MEDYYRFTIFQSKEIPVVMLNITIREKLLAYYHLRRLGIDDEKALEYKLAQVNNRFYFFQVIYFLMTQFNFYRHKKY